MPRNYPLHYLKLAKGLYYYTTYNNHQISCVNMHNENLDETEIIRYPIEQDENIKMIN